MPSPEVVTLAPEYSWGKTLWKGLRPALIAGGMACLAKLVEGIDVQWLKDLGIPIVLGTFIVESARNWWKQHVA